MIPEQPAWMAFAWRELGQREALGAATNPRIRALYLDAGHPEVTHDEVAWCAAFVGACLERARLTSSRSLLARSYLGWGEPTDGEALGSIAVLRRGVDEGAGHVGFLVGTAGDRIYLLGGNQGDAVTVAAFDRSELLALRRPGAARTSAGPEDDGFEAALRHVLAMEGGWCDDPYDPGGPTNFGVTLATFAAHRGVALDAANIAAVKTALRVIAPDEVRTIYRDRYWVTSRCGALPPALAVMHFDAAVNHGVGGAARMLQQALGVAIDGEIGDETLAAARALDPLAAADRYADLRRARYRSLGHFWRFGRGWLARVDKTQVAARAAHRSNTRRSKEPQMTPVQPLPSALPAPKWWGHSLTIWGAIVTTLATVLPALGPVIGIDISGEMVRELGDQLARAVQAVGGLVGIAMTVYGRFRATRPLERRDVQMRV